MNVPELIQRWHALVQSPTPAGLAQILADDVRFYSPVVYKPQAGKAITTLYLTAAFQVLVNQHFRYVREVLGDDGAVLEFETELDGVYINGVDLIRFNPEGQIVDFKVMVRPLKAIQALHGKMQEMMAAWTGGK